MTARPPTQPPAHHSRAWSGGKASAPPPADRSRTAKTEKAPQAQIRPPTLTTGVQSSRSGGRVFPSTLARGSYFSPKGTTCYASFGPDVPISVPAHPAGDATIIYLSSQPWSRTEQLQKAVGDKVGACFCRGAKGKVCHSGPRDRPSTGSLTLNPKP